MNFRTPENLRIFWSSFFVCSWTEFVLFCRTKENQKGRRCPQSMKAPVGLLSRRPVCEANAACSARQGHSDFDALQPGVDCSLLAPKENQKSASDFDALDPRIKGCSPLIIPKQKSKRKNASRFAQTGCGAQRPLRALSGTRVLLTAAPTAPPCIRRWRRSSPLHFFLASPIRRPLSRCGGSSPQGSGKLAKTVNCKLFMNPIDKADE